MEIVISFENDLEAIFKRFKTILKLNFEIVFKRSLNLNKRFKWFTNEVLNSFDLKNRNKVINSG